MARTSSGVAGELGTVERSQAILLRRAALSWPASARARRRGKVWRRNPRFHMDVYDRR